MANFTPIFNHLRKMDQRLGEGYLDYIKSLLGQDPKELQNGLKGFLGQVAKHASYADMQQLLERMAKENQFVKDEFEKIQQSQDEAFKKKQMQKLLKNAQVQALMGSQLAHYLRTHKSKEELYQAIDDEFTNMFHQDMESVQHQLSTRPETRWVKQFHHFLVNLLKMCWIEAGFPYKPEEHEKSQNSEKGDNTRFLYMK